MTSPKVVHDFHTMAYVKSLIKYSTYVYLTLTKDSQNWLFLALMIYGGSF